MCDPVSDVFQQFERNILNGRRDGIAGIDSPDDDRPVKGPLPVGNAGGLEIRYDCEVLPDLAFQAVLRKFLPQDGIGFTDSLQAVTGDGADTAPPGPGPGTAAGRPCCQAGRAACRPCGLHPCKGT